MTKGKARTRAARRTTARTSKAARSSKAIARTSKAARSAKAGKTTAKRCWKTAAKGKKTACCKAPVRCH